MISIRGLNFTYPGAQTSVLNDIDLDLEKGDFIALIGNNGCGKSTLCKVMNGLIPKYIQGDIEGEITLDGNALSTLSLSHIAQKIGYVYQDFDNQIVKPKVIDEVCFAPMNFGMADYHQRGLDALKEVGLLEVAERYVWELSGGQRHLVALAGVMALGAETLILDEPIAQLDPRHATLVYECLKRLNQQGKTIIVIEHHAEFIAAYCQTVVLMNAGHILFKLPVRDALNQVQRLLENDIYPPQVTQVAYALSGADKDLPINVREAEQWLKLNGHRMHASKRAQSKTPIGREEAVVAFKEIQLYFKAIKGAQNDVFEGLNLTLFKGEKVALIGNNGAGKTTLLKLLTGLIKPSQGDICISGRSIRTLEPEQIAKAVSYVYQNPEEMFIKDSIEKDIAYGMKVRQYDHCEMRTHELIEDYRLEPIKDRDGRLLSGGQMRRASLAIGVSLFPVVLLLDEPTANLDIGTRKEIHQTLKRLNDHTETVVIATHDMQLVTEWADRVIVLHEGAIIADDSVEAIFNMPQMLLKAGIERPPLMRLSQSLGLEENAYTVEAFVAHFENQSCDVRKEVAV